MPLLGTPPPGYNLGWIARGLARAGARRLDVTKSLQDWLSEGETLYNAALAEYQQIEQQLDELEAKLAAKKVELNQIAQVVGKPPVESSRRLTAELVEQHAPNSVPNSPATIARALTGRGLGR